MGCRILIGHEQGSTREVACLFDSVTETAFGPLFREVEVSDVELAPEEVAEAFMEWLESHPHEYGVPARAVSDPRVYPGNDLAELQARFLRELRGEEPASGKLPAVAGKEGGE